MPQTRDQRGAPVYDTPFVQPEDYPGDGATPNEDAAPAPSFSDLLDPDDPARATILLVAFRARLHLGQDITDPDVAHRVIAAGRHQHQMHSARSTG